MSLFSSSKKDNDSRGRDALAQRRATSDNQNSRPDGGGESATSPNTGGNVATIGKSIVFKGDLSGDEDLQIDGMVDGGIQLANHQLTIGDTGRAQAQLYAKSVVVIGQVTGNITATELVELQSSATVEGDIHTPRLVIADGAVLNGTVEMTKAQANTP
ncbi:MAG: polymer-forming cytoskeletal protein, partial [Myxococcota bacterium]|nr:polymer-forming cytoskeletal protein [Myxococcota bacterium]